MWPQKRKRPKFPFSRSPLFFGKKPLERILGIGLFFLLAFFLAPQDVRKFFQRELGGNSFSYTKKLEQKEGYLPLDGDSLRNRAQHQDIRLYGIDAPEYHQMCEDAQAISYACGQKAALHLKKLIGQHPPICQIKDKDHYGRLVAICFAGDIELNRQMVEDGWAVAYTAFTKDYEDAQAKARLAKRGIWSGTFEEPKIWRQNNRRHKGE